MQTLAKAEAQTRKPVDVQKASEHIHNTLYINNMQD